MAWNDASETLVAAGGQVYVAPVGTTLPADVDASLNAAFVGLGYTSDDGVSFSVARETTDFGAWQSFDPIRSVLASREIQATFQLLQWNEDTVPLAFGGGAVAGTTGSWSYDAPSPEDGIDERALILEAVDGDSVTRLLFARGVVIDAVEAQFNRTNMSALPITFKALAPTDGNPIYRILSNAEGFEAGS